MDKLTMQSRDVVGGNVEKIAALFPHCVTERLNQDGKSELAIDFDKLRAELSNDALEDGEERYQFTWPDKRAASRLANEPVNLTLRPCREESVDFDTTENLYIEGDNLDVLKVLRETYLGRVKMIYIDPPYNTGNDFVYNDDFAQGKEDFEQGSGLFDAEGNQTIDPMQRNTEANGRFHTDWLNMIYPRLKVARDLLTEDGVIFISIDDNEIENLRRICDEIFGAANFRNTILTRRRVKSLNSQFADNGLQTLNVGFEYVLVYAKSKEFVMQALRQKKAVAKTEGQWQGFWSNADRPTMRYDVLGFTPETGQWRSSREKAENAVANYKKFVDEYSTKMTLEEYYVKTGISDFIKRDMNGLGKNGGVYHWVPPTDTTLRTSNWMDIEVSQIIKEIDLPFDNPKNRSLITELIKLSEFSSTDIILDFFSGSATTAHAVMKLNSEDGGKRKFIMVQLPEVTDEKSEARKAGYENICEIGKERIRRAGKKIKEEAGQTADGLDTGFRVLKLDSSNMEDVFYTPDKFEPSLLDNLVDNIKADRSGEDLLLQVMLNLGIELSAKIERKEVAGKEVFSVDDDYLLACFDKDVNETTIEEMAKLLPTHLVIRDASAANDNVLDNFDQIIESYSNEKKITTHIL
ncbi:site-specific DNA-methyltransferase [uncultured Muribaculum sp.]|uniref:site-specific DNA-methyltransferase n=1 Tax=uncultured Muribaculum sp. TaxID=1918613 RepID=UPI0025AF4FC8|nr:site-specific DNA-methyltransferase [uncultured Muribaculum sp.]